MVIRSGKRLLATGLILAGTGAASGQELPQLPEPTGPTHFAPEIPVPEVPIAGVNSEIDFSGGSHAGVDHLGVMPTPGCLECYGSSGTPSWKQRLYHNLLGPADYSAVPFGASVDAHIRTQVVNGAAARMVLHEYDFAGGGPALNWRGKQQVLQIARLAAVTPAPVVVEYTPQSPQLAEARRQAVAAEFARAGVPVGLDRVVLGIPRAIPLRGVEAELVYEYFLIRTANGSQPIIDSGGFGSGSSFGGGGVGTGSPTGTGG